MAMGRCQGEGRPRGRPLSVCGRGDGFPPLSSTGAGSSREAVCGRGDGFPPLGEGLRGIILKRGRDGVGEGKMLFTGAGSSRGNGVSRAPTRDAPTEMAEVGARMKDGFPPPSSRGRLWGESGWVRLG